MLIPFRFPFYAVAAGDVYVALEGVAANPQVGEGTVEIEIIAVAPPLEELVIGGRRWYGILKDVEVHLKGVAAKPQIGSGWARVKRTRRGIPQQWEYPRPRLTPTLEELPGVIPRPVVAVELVGVKPVSAVGTGTLKVVLTLVGTWAHKSPELTDEEIMALLEAA